MTKFTNHTPGARGINLVGGETRWLEPGETAEIESKLIVGEAPDLGKPSDAASDDEGLEAVLAENDDLRTRVAALEAENVDLKAQVAKFDPDGDGKAGGSKPKADKPA